MIDRLRAFMDRPLRDTDRPLLFALIVVLLLAVAALLALLDEPAASPDRAPARATTAPAETAPSPAPAPASAAADEDAPSEEGKPPAAMRASRAHVSAAKRAARRFLTGYLPYLYGRRAAGQIQAADERLRFRLARERPRVGREQRLRRPAVVLLQAHGVARRRGELVALVNDGVRSYTVLLELERAPTGWRVTDVGS